MLLLLISPNRSTGRNAWAKLVGLRTQAVVHLRLKARSPWERRVTADALGSCRPDQRCAFLSLSFYLASATCNLRLI